MDEQLASVYGLKDRRNDEVFYVGMSTDPHARYGQHIAIRTAKDDKEARILDMRKDGLMPELIVFDHGLSVRSALERERHWIQHYQLLGVSLTNKQKTGRSVKKSVGAACEIEDKDSTKWIFAYDAFNLFGRFKGGLPPCVQYFARKQFIRRKHNGGKSTVYHKDDIIAYRDSLIQKGELPPISRKRKA